MSLLIIAFATLILGTLSSSIGEWLIHKYIMHRPFWFITFPAYAHGKVHHGIFGSDASYHLNNRPPEDIPEARGKIAAARWTFLVVIPLGTLPYVLAATPFAYFDWWAVAFTIGGVGFFVATTYYITYETIHWWMHLPKKRRIERSRLFIWLNGHHILHHRYVDKNLNVVLPFADILFMTKLWRSPVRFAQVRGPMIPDLQPKHV